jgi:NitT/TauT family transport system substrate-binding protein
VTVNIWKELVMHAITRRTFLRTFAASGGLALGIGLAGCGQGQSATGPTSAPPSPPPLARLIVKGPSGLPSIPLARLAQDETLRASVGDIDFSTWANPDQLRADVVAGALHLTATPTNVAATLYRRGIPLRLLNVTVWGILHLLSTNPTIEGWDDLRGQTIAVPLKGDMPDIVFRTLAKANGLDTERDLTLRYVSSMVEAQQLLLAGQVQIAQLGEPAATGAQLQGKQNNVEVRRVLNMQEEWGRATGRPPRIPMAGTLAVNSLVEQHPEVVIAAQDGLKRAVEWVRQNPEEAGQLGEQYLGGLKAPVIARALPNVPLEFVTAADARPELEFFFTRLKALSPDLIGGDLPDAEFYYP